MNPNLTGFLIALGVGVLLAIGAWFFRNFVRYPLGDVDRPLRNVNGNGHSIIPVAAGVGELRGEMRGLTDRVEDLIVESRDLQRTVIERTDMIRNLFIERTDTAATERANSAAKLAEIDRRTRSMQAQSHRRRGKSDDDR